MLFQTKTFQRTNIFQWISMNVGTFPIAPTAISNFQSTHIFYWVITPIIDKKFFAMKEKEGKMLRQMMTNFEHFMGALNKWGFVQAIAHTQGNLPPPEYG